MKFILKTAAILLIIYILVCTLLYFFQEKLIFFPAKLKKEYRFEFSQRFEEMNIKAPDGALLNGVLFKADSSKGVIFYLHGNVGSIRTWGRVAATYNNLGYDVFMLDYRGYGKSEGSIGSEEQVFGDVQAAYDQLKSRYAEKKIIVLGYSIGTGPAAKLASENSPRLLILQAPYYSLMEMMESRYPFLPTFILKYDFETSKYLKNCKMPVVIFHGNRDEVIAYESSVRLMKLFKDRDTLITLNAEGHIGMSDNGDYLSELKKILEKRIP